MSAVFTQPLINQPEGYLKDSFKVTNQRVNISQGLTQSDQSGSRISQGFTQSHQSERRISEGLTQSDQSARNISQGLTQSEQSDRRISQVTHKK